EMHMPFWDVETGHEQVYDVFRDQYMDVVATNELPANAGKPVCALTATGTRVQWEDSGCSAIPCPGGACGGGADCHTNAGLMDVSMLGSPTLCGVYRMDLQDWGGYDWTAYANCTADRTEQYSLYRDLATAVVNYHPLPELGIADVTVDEGGCDALHLSGTIAL